MSPQLDHALFPHIFDLIVDATDNDGKIVLRAVSRDLKRRTDAALFAHIELDQDPFDYTLSIRSPHGKLPGPPLPPSVPDFERDPGVWKERLKLARVLDVKTDHMIPDDQRDASYDHRSALCEALGGLQVVRRCQQSDWYYPINAPTFVDVINRDRWQTRGFAFFGDTWFPSMDSVTKHVGHIRYDPLYEGLHRDELTYVANARHVVFIFSPIDAALQPVREAPSPLDSNDSQAMIYASVDNPHSPIDDMSDARLDCADRSRCVFGSRQVVPLTNPETGRPLPVARSPVHSFVRGLLDYVASEGAAEKVTFVGLCQMERHLLGLDPSFDDGRVENALRVAMRVGAICAEDLWEDEYDSNRKEIDKILENVHFMTREGYRAEVGAEAWEMETGFVPLP